MSTKTRLDTMRVIVTGHAALRSSPALTDILHEINRIAAAERTDKNDSWLLKVLHSTRALDTSLSEVLAHKGWTPQGKHSLGAYLTVLAVRGVLTPQQRNDFQRGIADKRNRYMHRAGAMPDRLEANSILNEMDVCLAVVLANT